MSTMRVAQVARPDGPFELVQRTDRRARCGRGPTARRGVRRLPQRCLHQGRNVSGHRVAPSAGSRSRRPDRRARVAGAGLDGRRSSRRRLARRSVRDVRFLPPRKFFRLPDVPSNHRHHRRWRLRRVHAGAPFGAGPGSERAHRGGGGATDVRGGHDLQFAAQQRRAPRRAGRGARSRRPRTPGGAVRREDGIPRRRHRPWCRQGGVCRAAGRASLRRQPGAEPGQGTARISAARRSSWPRRPVPRRCRPASVDSVLAARSSWSARCRNSRCRHCS